MKMKNLFVASVFAFGASFAMAEHTDVEIVVEAGNLEVEPSPEGFVFEGEFGEDLNPANFANEPGFEVDDGIMSSGDTMGFNVVQDLLYWDGSSFGAVPGGHSLVMELAVFSKTLDGSGDAGAGFTIGTADIDGGMHQDLDFTLLGPGAPGGLTTGAYGLWLEMTSPQYGTSNEFIIMLNYGLDEEDFEAGVEAAAALVPEPASIFLLVAGLGLIRRR